MVYPKTSSEKSNFLPEKNKQFSWCDAAKWEMKKLSSGFCVFFLSNAQNCLFIESTSMFLFSIFLGQFVAISVFLMILHSYLSHLYFIRIADHFCWCCWNISLAFWFNFSQFFSSWILFTSIALHKMFTYTQIYINTYFYSVFY